VRLWRKESPDSAGRGVRRKAEVRQKANMESGTETRYPPHKAGSEKAKPRREQGQAVPQFFRNYGR